MALPAQSGPATEQPVQPAPDPEDIRVGYASAVDLAIYDGQLSWTITGIYVQFAFLMVAGAIFPSFVGSDDNQVLALAGLAISLAGIIITGMFGSTVSRVRVYESYWVLKAAALERLLDEAVSTVNGSMELSARRSVMVGPDRVRMRRIESVKSRHMLLALLVAFFIAFLGVFILNVWRLTQAF